VESDVLEGLNMLVSTSLLGLDPSGFVRISVAEDAGEESGHIHHLSRILFCTDFSEYSEQALTYALSVRAEYDAELTLVHVFGRHPESSQKGKSHSGCDGTTR
jgi:Universal stress protein family